MTHLSEVKSLIRRLDSLIEERVDLLCVSRKSENRGPAWEHAVAGILIIDQAIKETEERLVEIQLELNTPLSQILSQIATTQREDHHLPAL